MTPPTITDAAVESVMNDLLGEPVAIIQRFNRPLRDRYMDNLRDHVRQALVKAFDPRLRCVDCDTLVDGGTYGPPRCPGCIKAHHEAGDHG